METPFVSVLEPSITAQQLLKLVEVATFQKTHIYARLTIL